MRIKQKYIMMLCLTMFGMTSCDIDDVVPQFALVEDNVIRDEKSAQEMLNGTYEKFRGFTISRMVVHFGQLSGELIKTGSIVGIDGFETNNVTPDNEFIEPYYQDCYGVVNQANWIIEQLESKDLDFDADSKAEIIAQAKIMRAMGHFLVLRSFGQFYDLNSEYGIVVRTKPAKSLEAKERNTVQESYDSIINDLTDAIEDAPTGVAHYYMSASVAQALLAKVYLYMGDYAAVSASALAVIDNTDSYGLEANFADVFTNTFNSQEVLFAPFVDGVDEFEPNMQLQRTAQSPYLQTLADAQIGTENDGDILAGTGFDPRFTLAYHNPMQYSTGHGKYPIARVPGNTVFYLRMVEVYLIYAEAEARLATGISDTHALAAISRVNEIRARVAGLAPIAPATVNELITSIREEKLLELFAETGESWFDLVRNDVLGNVNASDIKPFIISDNQFILPMPLKALAGNNKLVPNPGY